MAYLDQYLRKPSKRVASSQRRAALVRNAAEIMEGWRLTPFEYQGMCRAAIRSALCLSGAAWGAADGDAMDIVIRALAAMGAERPSWDDGQPEVLTPRDECAWCHGPIESDPDHVKRFCSTECARISILRRNESGGYRETLVGRSAFKLIERSTKKPRLCIQCGTEFRPVNNGKPQSHCSRACVDASLKTNGFTHECQQCGSSFVTRMTRSKYCSMECSSSAQSKPTTKRYIVKCEWCGAHFIGKAANARMCCQAHKLASSRYKRGVSDRPPPPSNVIYLTAQVFDGWFKQAA